MRDLSVENAPELKRRPLTDESWPRGEQCDSKHTHLSGGRKQEGQGLSIHGRDGGDWAQEVPSCWGF